MQSSNNQLRQQQWGQAGDVPVPADYDGDGKTDTAVWRPSAGVWYLLNSSDGSYSAPVLGSETSGDITVPADYDGDHKADVAMWRPSTGTWTIKRSLDGVTVTPQQGASGDVAVPSAYIRRSSAPANQGAPIVRDGLANVSYEATSNRITTSGFQYDPAGNQTRILAQDGTSWQPMEYDAANRLIKVKDDAGNTIQSFTYGATNARLVTQDGNEQSNNRTYYAWAGGSVLAEYVEMVPNSLAWAKCYIYLADSLLSTYTAIGSDVQSLEYYHPDRLGTRLVTNSSGSAATELATLPFGTSLTSESTGSIRRTFTSYDRSLVTGLDYAINRHYDSGQGRFTQVDPIQIGASSRGNPQSWNLYNYCGNDPVNQIDPNGMFWGKLFKWIGKALKWIAIAVMVAAIVMSGPFAPAQGTILAKILGWIFGFGSHIGMGANFLSAGSIIATGANEGVKSIVGAAFMALLSTGSGALASHLETRSSKAKNNSRECAFHRLTLLGNLDNRRRLNEAWNKSKASTPSREVGGLIGDANFDARSGATDIQIGKEFPTAANSPRTKLVGFSRWARLTIAEDKSSVAYEYWYHTHALEKGEINPDTGRKITGSPDLPSEAHGDLSVSNLLNVMGVLVTRRSIIVFDGSGIKCKFSRE